MRHLLQVACLLSFLLPQVNIAQTQPNPAELRIKQHQFDFWLGKWDVYKFGTDTLVGHSHIETIIDSVAILENYRSTRGPYKGKSLNKYNQATGKWQQFWVDNGGLTLEIAGGLEEGNMVLRDSTNRVTWAPQPDGSVRQSWDITQDNGATWNRVFDGIYRRKTD